MGASVLVLDRSDEGRATDAGAGIVAPAVSSMTNSAWHELAGAAARAYPKLAAELDSVGLDTGYRRVGLLSVGIDDDGVERFEAFMDRVTARLDRYGHPTGHDVRLVDPDEARRQYPALGQVRVAAMDTGAARVDAKPMSVAMLTAAVAAGAEVREASVDSVHQLLASQAELVVIAGGAWSARFGSELGVEIPVEPQRGQIVHLSVPESLGDTADWPMLSQLTDQYQVSWPNGKVAVGATRETGSGFVIRNSVDGVREVLDEATMVAPGLRGAAIEEIRVGVRPLTPDQLPVIGRVPDHPNVILATGHGATGLMTGPYSGRLAADIALGEPIGLDLEPFRVNRSYR